METSKLRLFAAILFMALLPTAARAASSPEELARAHDLISSREPERAMQLAARWLREDPWDLAVHELHIQAGMRGLRQGPTLDELYRAWMETEPERPEPGIALAMLLEAAHGDPGPWCDEVEELLAGQLPAEPLLRYWALRTRYRVRRDCPGEREQDRADLVTLGATLAQARSYALQLRVLNEPVDEALADELAELYAREPWNLAGVGCLWSKQRQGPALERAQAEALAAARALAQSEEPMILADVVTVLRWAKQEQELEAAEARLTELDPQRSKSWGHGQGLVRWMPRDSFKKGLYFDIVRSSREDEPKARIKALAALEEQLPAEGPLRAEYWTRVATARKAMKDHQAALEARRAAWQAHPQDPELARSYAWAARKADQDLEGALAALEQALTIVERWDPQGYSWAAGVQGWIKTAGWRRARLLEVQGELLRLQDQHEEARDALCEALLTGHSRTPYLHVRLGMVYDALGQQELALAHLGQGYAEGGEKLDDWWKEARQRLEELFQQLRWHPAGCEGWIAALAATLEQDEQPTQEDPTRTEAEAWLEDRPFPDLELIVDGQPTRLSQIAGWRVVDLWATWCGPCIVSLPHMSRAAKRWKDRITVLAVSVDSRQEDMLELLEDRRDLRRGRYTIAWAGQRGMEAAKTSGIPAVFILDPEGRIRGHYMGSGVGDARLDKRLERLLGPLDP